jgi:exopolyphosphatase/guanosine-5'-triphosphate,3'-diphosphate pyrophosphatase
MASRSAQTIRANESGGITMPPALAHRRALWHANQDDIVNETSTLKRLVRRDGRRALRRSAILAVVDIGSNSGRVTVVRLLASGHLEIVADARAPLRLARELRNGELSRTAITRTLAALHDFRAIALGAGASRILAVATSAVRESSNAGELVERARRELGIDVVVIDGELEAAYAFLGAVHGLPVDHGLLLDLGGGSLEVTHFRDRKLRRSWTLPLGALRLSDRFLTADPPAAAQIARLEAHVQKTLRKAGVPALDDDEHLLGTGGTIRNIARMEARARRDVLPHVHGSVLGAARVRTLAQRARRLGQAQRGAIAGLNRDRADSIVGGLVTVQTAMRFLGASEIQVSGQGLREGIALASLGLTPPSAREVREASVRALTARFSTCRRTVAMRRVQIAERLLEILEPQASGEMRETLQHVCSLLDIGRSVNFFDRHRSAAQIVVAADLHGFSRRAIALLFAVLMQAGSASERVKTLRPLLRGKDGGFVLRAAALLSVADEIERRALPGQPLQVAYQLTKQALILDSEALRGWRPRAASERFRRAFGRELRIVGRS